MKTLVIVTIILFASLTATAAQCPNVDADVRSLAMSDSGWRVDSNNFVQVFELWKSENYDFYSACLNSFGEVGEKCIHYTIDDSCQIVETEKNAHALNELIKSRFKDFSYLESNYLTYFSNWSFDPDYLFQGQIADQNVYMLYQVLSFLKYGSLGFGLKDLQLGGSAIVRHQSEVNAPWDWELDPGTVELMQEYEECDTWPKYINSNLTTWTSRQTKSADGTIVKGYTCPWNLGVVGVLFTDVKSGKKYFVSPISHSKSIRDQAWSLYNSTFRSSTGPLRGANRLEPGRIPNL